jgi:hypothetical protein
MVRSNVIIKTPNKVIALVARYLFKANKHEWENQFIIFSVLSHVEYLEAE